jgi:hypothetical protein
VPGTQASDIALVLDRSSSMESQGKLRAALDAIRHFVDGARVPPDQLALVTFAGVAGVNQPLVADKEALRRALGGVITSGGTRIDLGLKAAREELAGPRRLPGHGPVLVLLSDGVQAPGEEHRVLPEADAVKAAGVLVFTIALGGDADRALLERIASSPAHAYFAPTPVELAGIYARIAVAIPCPPTPPPPPTVTRTPEPPPPTELRPATATPTPQGATAEPSPTGGSKIPPVLEWSVYLPIGGSMVRDEGN